MTTLTTSTIRETEIEKPVVTRVPWRQRLVDMEQGIRGCLRNDSTIFVHLFLATLTFSAAFILNVPLLHCLVLIFCLMTILASELFHFALMETLDAIEANQTNTGKNQPDEKHIDDLKKNPESMEIKSNRYQNARTASTAAVMMTILLSCILTSLIFYNQLREFF